MVALSEPMEVDLEVYRGDTGRFRVTVTKEDLTPVDLTLAQWDADIRSSGTSPAVVASFNIELVEDDTSSIDVILDEENADKLVAGDLVYDVEMRMGGEVVTLIKGKMVVTQDVSRPL